jgi:DNA mismatch endonuclease (patch repair protein)
MPDVFNRKKRSEVMSKIRSKGTRIELSMKKGLEEKEIEFQYQPKIEGKPDFLIPPKVAVFCDSSFWHGRHWSKLQKKLPNQTWRDHIRRNRERDRLVSRELRASGFIVLRFWDYQIHKHLERCIGKIERARFLRDKQV